MQHRRIVIGAGIAVDRDAAGLLNSVYLNIGAGLVLAGYFINRIQVIPLSDAIVNAIAVIFINPVDASVFIDNRHVEIGIRVGVVNCIVAVRCRGNRINALHIPVARHLRGIIAAMIKV